MSEQDLLPTDPARRAILLGGMVAMALPLVVDGAARAAEGGSVASLPWPSSETIRLWPGDAPGAPTALPIPGHQLHGTGDEQQLWITGIDVPILHVFRPARPNGIGVLVLPGGGYGFLSVQNEGSEVAARFTAAGMTVFVLTYRLPGEGWTPRADVPLQDAQRAMRLVRASATRFGLNPASLAVIGFSAGGHLAASLVTNAREAVYTPIDAVDQMSARPDFAGLIYPVIAMAPPLTHGGSRDNLLGPDPSSDLVTRRSPAEQVTADTPPCFLVHALDDGLVPPDNSLVMLQALRAHKVTAELHLFSEGGHGFGLRLPAGQPGARWPDLFLDWVRRRANSPGKP